MFWQVLHGLRKTVTQAGIQEAVERMKIAIMSTMPPNTYSGGRYDAWTMAEGLAARENTVWFITNNHPIFYDDFKEYEGHDQIRLVITADFQVDIYEDELDYVVLVPNQDKTDYFYLMCRNFARKKKAKLVLRNFESPNWFNQYSPVHRDEKMWEFWKDTCNDGCLVLSNSKESMKYAKEYYTEYPQYTRFDYWYPAINSKAADKVCAEKEKRIISFVRFADKHKGGEDIIDIAGEYLAGYTLVFVVGNGQWNAMYDYKLEFLSKKYDFQYEIRRRLSDEEKFKEIKKARFMLFPSYFEGYGYPPVEAQYCNTICIAYDLPVLRETNKEGVIYCERGNILAMQEALKAAVENYEEKELKTQIRELGDFNLRADAICDVLKKYLQDDYRNPKAPYLRIVKPVLPETKRKISMIHQLKRIYPRFVRRCKEGMHVVYNKALAVKRVVWLRKMPIHLGENFYDRITGRLYMKGWYLAWREIDRVQIENSHGTIIGYAVYGQKRSDVYEKYPQYGTMLLGWEYDGTVDAADMGEFVRVRIVCSDGKLSWGDFLPEVREGMDQR